MLKRAWRQFLHPEREVGSHLAKQTQHRQRIHIVGKRNWEPQSPNSLLHALSFKLTSPSCLIFEESFNLDTTMFNMNHGLFVYVFYLCFKFKFSVIYSRSGNN